MDHYPKFNTDVAALLKGLENEPPDVRYMVAGHLETLSARVPRPIATAQDADDLPEGAVIREGSSTIYQKDTVVGWDGRVWFTIGGERPYSAADLDFPVTLIHTP